FATGTPKEYITLVSGRSKNYAVVYDKIGSKDSCEQEYPETIYSQHGRTEFYRVRVNVPQLSVVLDDFTFSVGYGAENTSFGFAGDMYAYQSTCKPLGQMSIDLQGTPFIISPDVKWVWSGNFADGSTNGQVYMKNSGYIGCFSDAGERLLPASKIDDTHLTPDKCIQHCSNGSFQYAGVEFSHECWCGDSYSKYSRVQESDCNRQCDGGNVVDSSPTCASCPNIALKGVRPIPALRPQTMGPCLSGRACNGTDCSSVQQPVVSSTVDCPMGLLPTQCGCTGSCTGARFNNDRCLTQTGKSQITCVAGSPGRLSFTDVHGTGTAHCPNRTQIVGCSYWDNAGHFSGNGLGTMNKAAGTCTTTGCPACTAYARCQAYTCGCQNGATCTPVTGQCSCPPGYYGNHCELFDYCAYYEDNSDDHQAACTAGTCQAIPNMDIRTFGGEQSSNAGTCVFPFAFTRNTFTQCVDTNETVTGGVMGCRDFGLYMQNGHFMAYYSPASGGCTAGLQGSAYNLDQWYLLSVTNNGTHITLFTNGIQQAQTAVKPYFLGTSEGFRIGGAKCCAGENFKGYIKSVKMWKRAMDPADVSVSMTVEASINSTLEALQQGLVAHYELGQLINVSCQGIDHGGEDWTLQQDQDITGVHCNINRFTIPKGITVQVAPFDGTSGGSFDVYAEEIYINGYLNAAGVGYRGGQSPDRAQQDGVPGESYHTTSASNSTNIHLQPYQPHRGGGGGGWGGSASHPTSGNGSPGGGGGYGTAGGVAQKNSATGKGQGGAIYGSPQLDQMYLGSGGGSGGNAADLSSNPKGGRGGNGGGAVGLFARSIVQIQGHVSVAGQNGQGDIRLSPGCGSCPAACQASSPSSCYGNSSSACWDKSGPGGGGSGGSLYIVGNTVDVGWDRLWHQGGAGGLGSAQGCGGDGGYGRIRVDAVTFRGQLPPNSKLNDLSISGQKLIQYSSDLQYGNEIYWGCFQDVIQDRHFAFTLPVNDAAKRQMTPQYCMSQCRQRGYAFSSVEYGYECYCDNSLQLKLRKPDNDCSQPCTGDHQQFCGAAYRMSVYGPKPFVPVDGMNGAQQQCRPWCVTGGVYSNAPEWGFCDLSSSTANSYQIRCQCPDGFQGANCDQVCPQGSWGTNCGKVCICNSTNTDTCNPEDGTCNCKPGYQGATCDLQCSPGTYGIKCTGKCNCPSTSVCDYVTGECQCVAGWRGEQCQFRCPPGKYGAGCTQSCQCFQGSCSPEDGTCTCDDGYKLPFCSEKCDPGNYGPNCLHDCDCHGQSCDAFTGICSCGPGYQGSRCEQSGGDCTCPNGYYGNQCSTVCSCVHGKCSSQSGLCDCDPGWQGIKCDTPCADGNYGCACLKLCQCQHGNCSTVDGSCTCEAGYQGPHCDQTCPTGTFGVACSGQCQECGPGAQEHGCNPVTGACLCRPGYFGLLCDRPCPENTYGDNCSMSCGCINGDCSNIDGQCECYPGFTGTACDQQCTSGTWGPDCSNKCTCQGHFTTCDTTTGECQCAPGFTGACEQDVRWGEDCAQECDCSGQHCDFKDGICRCNPGKTGRICDQTCDSAHYGFQCGQLCQCKNNATCDPVSGECSCAPGWDGQYCDQPCPLGKYGRGCALNCPCAAGTRCHATTGACLCQPGYKGQSCNIPCPAGFWDVNCASRCPSNCPAGCMADSGQCKCTTNSCPGGFVCVSSGFCISLAYAGPFSSVSSSGSLSGGAIAGIIIGFLVGMVLVGGLVFVLMRQRNALMIDRLFSIFNSDSVSTAPKGEYNTQDPSVHGSENPMYLDTYTPTGQPQEQVSSAIITLQTACEDASES
ncbi:hypothetical protein BaRGS_00013130, partial [Batillaria attramentaria]